METGRLRRFILLLYFYLLHSPPEVLLFPVSNCHTSDRDLLIVFDSYVSQSCSDQDANRKFINGVIDVFLAPEEENLNRLQVAVASFTSSGPAMHVPFQNCSKQEFINKIYHSDVCSSNESPMTNNKRVFENILTSINASFTAEHNSRGDVNQTVVMVVTENNPISFTVDLLYQKYRDEHGDDSFDIFFIQEIGIHSYMSSNAIALESRSRIAQSHIFPIAICKQCRPGWFKFVWETEESEVFSCFYLHQDTNMSDWLHAKNQCYLKHESLLAAVETEEELTYLNSELRFQLQKFTLDKSLAHTVRDFLYMYVYIDAFQSEFVPGNSEWSRRETQPPIHNWNSASDVLQRDLSQGCGAWLYKISRHSSIIDEINDQWILPMNLSAFSDSLTQGWVDIPCGQLLSKFALCKITIPKLSRSTEILSPSEESRNKAMERSSAAVYQSELVSVSGIVEMKLFDNVPDTNNIDYNFPVFPCDDNYDSSFHTVIPYLYVCDHKHDCITANDEDIICEYRPCERSEFQCVGSSQCIPSEAVCDLFQDCYDGSDEKYCQHTCSGHNCCSGGCIPKHWVGDGVNDCPRCDENDEQNDENVNVVSAMNPNEKCVFICNRIQCVYPSQLNDGVVDCQGPEGPLDETVGALDSLSKDLKSQFLQKNLTYWAPKCIYILDRYVSVLGFSDLSHLHDCTDFECPEGYVKCPESYCIPLHYVNNGRRDCSWNEDENFFLRGMTCSGNFRCSFSNKRCIHPSLVCDGRDDCGEGGEDEFNCNVSCSPGFNCIAGTVTVRNYDKKIPLQGLDFIDHRTRYLDLSGVDISSAVVPGKTGQLHNLIDVALSHCNISSIGYGFADAIGSVGSIYWMNLSHKAIREIPSDSVFRRTTNLRILDLSHNKKLTILGPSGFDGSNKLKVLNLSYTGIFHLQDSAFTGISYLKMLNLSYTLIISLLNNNFPSTLVVHTLDLRGTAIRYFDSDTTFDGLRIQENLYADDFSLCCSEVRGQGIPEYTCQAPRDSISSCTDLIQSPVQRVLLWLVGIVALLGNTIVIMYRLIWDKDILKKAYGVFVTNLGRSDFIMGVYLIIIAGADQVYREIYVLNSRDWRFSLACQVSGFLSTLSSETSIFFIFLVTLDRLLVIKFPFGDIRISKVVTIILVVLSWMFGLILAIIPLLPVFGTGNIYTSNALCLGLPLTTDRPEGWGFSAAIFIVLNFGMFVLIALGQFLIYRAMSSKKAVLPQNTARRAQDIMVAKQLSLVVLSDFLCWFPIGVMGLAAISGNDIDREAYAWSAVLVLPVNSALNPLLYTIPVIINKWENFKYGKSAGGTVHNKRL